MKVLLELILMLQLPVISGELVYYRHGQEVVLPCGANPPDSCSITIWLRLGLRSEVVQRGKVVTGTPQAARLSITAGCSLVITNVTAEDVDLYTCRQDRDTSKDQSAALSVLTLSPSPPDADPNRELGLTCSLSIYENAFICKKNSVRWLNETGGEMMGDGVGDSELRFRPDNTGTAECVSVLTGQNRKRTCQFVNNNHKVVVEVHYTPDFTEVKTSDPSTVAVTVGVVGVVVLVAITVALIIYRKKAKVTESIPKASQHADDSESLTYTTISHANQQPAALNQDDSESLTYTTISHANQQPAALNQVIEEVTYAAVKTDGDVGPK